MLLRTEPSKVVVNAAQDLTTRQYKQQASLVVVQAEDTKNVLVVKRFKDNQIGLPCGKVDKGENIRDAAIRELFEETGVKKEDLSSALLFQQDILFDGTLVNVFRSTVAVQPAVVEPAEGFENETSPFWVDPYSLANTESRFQSFNIVALFNAGLIS